MDVPDCPAVRGQPSQAQGSFEWDEPPRSRTPATSPILAVQGFEGPLDWLLEMVRAKKIDLASLSILALVDAFVEAMAAALARAPETPAPDLARWADWTVMATQLTELRSRLLLPSETPGAQQAQADAEALRRHWLRLAATAAAADWLERRPQLRFDVFARGRPEPVLTARPGEAGATVDGWQGADHDSQDAGLTTAADIEDLPVPGGDLTDLLRACLVALRLPPGNAAFQPRRPVWSIGDAAARITRLLHELPEGGTLGAFLPEIVGRDANRAWQCSAAVAATFVAGLELTRGGVLTLDQRESWQPIHMRATPRCDSTADGVTDVQPLARTPAAW